LSRAEIDDKFKLSTEINLLKRLINHGFSIAFNSAGSKEEEEFISTRKDRELSVLKSELKELKKLLS